MRLSPVGPRLRAARTSARQSPILPGQFLSCQFPGSEWIDGGIAADEHAVAGVVVAEAHAVAAGHNRPALDLVGLTRKEGVKRGVVVADADVGGSVAELARRGDQGLIVVGGS